MATKKDRLTTLSQAGTITVASLAATDLASSGFGTDADDDGIIVSARIIATISADDGGLQDISSALVGIADDTLTNAEAEEKIEAVPGSARDVPSIEQSARYSRVLGQFEDQYGQSTFSWHGRFDSGWIKVLLPFHEDYTTIMRIFVYNMGAGAFDAQTSVRHFTQVRVRYDND